MAPLDWILLAALLASAALGAWRGLVYEVLSVLNWVAAFVLAQCFAAQAAAWLPMSGWSESVRFAAGFVLVFVGALFVGGLLAWLMKKLIEAVGLRPVDRSLGALFGLVRAVVLILVAAVVVNLTALRGEAWWTESTGAQVATVALKGLKPVLPASIGQHLPG